MRKLNIDVWLHDIISMSKVNAQLKHFDVFGPTSSVFKSYEEGRQLNNRLHCKLANTVFGIKMKQ